jgi:hypothetical protein
MQIAEMPAPDLAALLEQVSRLKHDLGKYVRFQGRWLPPDAGLDARREALATDLLHTRRGPDGSVDALQVWADFAPALEGLEHPELTRVRDGMAALRPVLTALRDAEAAGRPVDAGVVEAGERAAETVADAVRRLARAVRQAAADAGVEG